MSIVVGVGLVVAVVWVTARRWPRAKPRVRHVPVPGEYVPAAVAL